MIIATPICYDCKWYRKPPKAARALTCDAFPNGIPREILDGRNPHREIFPGQEGKYVFKRR